MSSHIQNVAIVGAGGRIGGAFAKALVQTGKHNVTGLTRHDSNSELPEGVKPVKVDYNDQDSIAAALKGQQFLVITLSATAPEELHARLAAAAAQAGVSYIMPNAFGYPVDTEKPDEGNPYISNLLGRIASIDKSGASHVMLSCGFWYEWSLALGEQWFGFNIKERKVTVFDDGKRVITVSTWDQCGRALAGLLSLPEEGPSPSLANYKGKQAKIQSFRISQRDMLDSLNRVLGLTDGDWEIRYESVEKRIKDGGEEAQKGIRTGFAKWLYGNVFLASNEVSDYEGVDNKPLGLPAEDLDEATKRTVDMVESGWTFKV
ncbi:hypothetical protein F5X68DRAFT_237236 [Plectosphaerella plurivora]|uniref:NAD(P)-binding domain-containing protein n=1 Tax=Plectosphaerella plurivora TaxID=936078 RepID=A0A9P8V1I2_9PEZI|nr:hypothetical protein F5X68DRAFT_237236 [Plectosphaerella plurivora]